MRQLIVFSFFLIMSLCACTHQPVTDIATFAHLTPKVEISRDRDLVISPLNHIGLYLETTNAVVTDSENTQHLLPIRLEQLVDGVNRAVGAQFYDVSRLDSRQGVNPEIDFIIEAYVLALTLTEISTDKPKTSATTTKQSSDSSENELIIPTDYLTLKVFLKDARSDRVIDTALIDARSGQLSYQDGYSKFANHAFEQYLKHIIR